MKIKLWIFEFEIEDPVDLILIAMVSILPLLGIALILAIIFGRP